MVVNMNQLCIKFILLNMAMISFTFSKDVRVHNITNKLLYAAIYYRPFLLDKRVKRKQSVIAIDSLAFCMKNLPPQKLKSNRYLAVATSEHDLPEFMDKEAFDGLCAIGVGAGTGGLVFDAFYIVDKYGILKAYDPLSFKILDIKDTLIKNIKEIFDGYRFSLAKHASIVTENKYKNDVAHIRVSKQLCDQEKAYLDARIPKVKDALEKLLNKKLNGSYVPKIALINSGGGARSLVSCIGFHIGAQEIGILDAITYDVGLSGGAWFVALWMQSGKDIHAFKQLMQPLMQNDLFISDTANAKLFADALIVRFGLRQPVTLVNSWGALIANRYLSMYGDKRHQMMLSDIAEHIKDGSVPFPILSTTGGYVPESFENRPKVPWCEFTPYEIGGVGDWLGNAFVPTWAFGREFEKNQSIDNTPELDLGGLMGICGSAFAFSFARGYDKKIKDLPIIGAFTDHLLSKVNQDTQYSIGKKRFTVGKVHNFAKDVFGASVAGHRHLKMVDGGISFNLPYPPVSGHGARKADMLILCDASSSIERKGPTNLYMIEKYAREHNLKFPKIDAKRVAQQVVSVFKDESDPEVPLVIYLPRIVAEGLSYPNEVPEGFSTAFKTSKFAYNKKEFDALSAVTETNIMACKDLLIKEISAHINRNSGF